MDLSELLKQHQLWLDKAHAALTTTTDGARDLMLPLDLKRQRVIEITERIADLSRQRDGAIRRFDIAIARHQEELAGLKLEIANAETTPQRPIEPRDEKPIAQPEQASEPSKTAVSRQKTAASRPTKTAKKSRKPKT